MSQLPGVRLDPAAAYPEVAALRAALRAEDWTTCRTLLDGVDPHVRSTLIALCGVDGGAGFLCEVWQADRTDTTAAVFLGVSLTRGAWAIRSAARARHVSREQFAAFHAGLRNAEQALIEAAARDPHDAAAWTARLDTARGLELGQSEARRRYDRAVAALPHHLPAQLALLQQLCPKWSGSWAKAHGFAREVMLDAPPGAPNAVVVADAHIEHWLDLEGAEEKRYSRGTRDELHEAAERSVWHPDFRRDVGWVRVMSTFAVAFTLAADHAAAGRAFVALGDLASERPFDYLATTYDVAESIEPIRRRALRAAGAMR